MLRRGKAPYLECSSKGSKVFSAFYARIRGLGNRTIEEIYQGYKIFDSYDASGKPIEVTGLSVGAAKGKKPKNIGDCRAMYNKLWRLYMQENEDLWPFLERQTGLCDRFGQEGHACQADSLWILLCEYRMTNKVCSKCHETSLANTPEEVTTCEPCKAKYRKNRPFARERKHDAENRPGG